MRYNLREVFEQSMSDKYSADLSGKSCKASIVYGIKSIMDRETLDIKIYNTTKGGNYYQEIDDQEYNIFYENGWRFGVYTLYLSNIKRKLDHIEANIKKEVNGRLSKKAISGWKLSRTLMMGKYSKISKKLNKLKL
tara:strand:+ start:367 stop:774 length:408 start_codon:yes stop_codon:yes gene_type:complete